MLICCAACDKPILDKFLLTVLERTWHADCVRCADCCVPLTEKCFSRDGKLFCRTDFFRRFGTKCSGCLQGISPQDLVRKARDRVFHLKCFTCCVCRKQLSTGEELYVLDENKFICKHDYLNGKAMADSFGPHSEDEEEEILDIKPQLDAHTHTPTTTPPTSSTPSIADASPLGPLPPPLPPSSVTSPSSLPMSHSGSPVVGATTPTSALVGLLGRAGSPGSHLGIATASGTPLHDSMSVTDKMAALGSFSVGLTDSPNDKDLSGNFHDSDVSDTEASNEAKDHSSVDGPKLADDDKVSEMEGGNKRRGPRTTIKAKQLEVLKAAFASTPKPTRHIREQLAKETGLPMRVIQVWFQNKRSKERRMKQLSSLGMRAHLFANPRKLRGMRMSPGIEDGYPYYGDAFGYGPQGFHDFFPGQGPPPPPGMGFPHGNLGILGLPPAMEQPLPPGGPMGDFPPIGTLSVPPASEGPFLNPPPPEIIQQRSSPESMILAHGGQVNMDHPANEGLVW